LTGGSAGELFRLPGGAALVGRAPQADVRISDEGVSRLHARVTVTEGRGVDAPGPVTVEDLGSANGTYLNGERLAHAAPLAEGDKVRIGPVTVLRFGYHDELDDSFYEGLMASAVRDPLTRLYNKRYLLDRLEGELRFARRHDSAVTLLMLDVDHFKRVNDDHGHLAGDAVLVHLAAVLERAVRNEDVIARFGGEEIAVLLRAVGIERGAALGERLRRIVERTPARQRGVDLPVTVSVGVAGYPSTPASTAEQLIEAADLALYRAKHAGRNRVAR
jgi:diguanylate cyclase (GGDEF)-like protein